MPYENPLTSADLNALTVSLLTGMQTTVVVLAVVFIIIGALIYLTSAGDESRTTWAKKAILAAVLGLALAVAAPMFLREIGVIMGWTPTNIGFGTSLTLTALLGNILSFLLALVGVVALIMLIIGAFLYITAGGETDRADTGKKIVKFAVLGIIVTLAGLVLIRQVASFFS